MSSKLFRDDLKFKAYRLYHSLYKRISDARYVLEMSDSSAIGKRVLPPDTEIIVCRSKKEAPEAEAVGQSSDEMSNLFDAGGRLYTLYVRGQLASYGWTRRGADISHWTIPLSSDDIVISRCFTRPAFRGHGYITDVIAAMLAEGGWHEGCRFLTDVHVANKPSLNQFLRTGWRIIARARAPGKR